MRAEWPDEAASGGAAKDGDREPGPWLDELENFDWDAADGDGELNGVQGAWLDDTDPEAIPIGPDGRLGAAPSSRSQVRALPCLDF